MFIPGSSVGLVFALVSLLCWGSWSNGFVLAQRRPKPFRFELYYIDFSIAMPIMQLVFCATLGQVDYNGDASSSLSGGEMVLTDELPGKGDRIAWALASGAVFNISNILLVNAIAIAGMAVAFPLGVGTALVLGTVVTYIIDPSGKAGLLFAGVGLAFIAVCLVALTHWLKEKEAVVRELDGPRKDEEDGPVVTQPLLKEEEKQKPGIVKTIGIALLSGVLMGLWNPCIVKAMKHNGPNGDGLSPYAALMWFQVACCLSTFIYQVPLMRAPLTGEPPVPWSDYCATGDLCAHALGWLGGVAWCVGTTANVVGGGSVGFAVSYAIGQSAPAAATLWGILVWREFDNTSLQVKLALVGVFVFYAGAITCVALSK